MCKSCWLYLCWWISCSKVCWFQSPPHYIMKLLAKQCLKSPGECCIRLIQPLQNINKQQTENKPMNPWEQSVRTKRWGERLDWETEDLFSADEYYMAVFCTIWDIVCLCSLEWQLHCLMEFQSLLELSHFLSVLQTGNWLGHVSEVMDFRKKCLKQEPISQRWRS